MDNPTLLNTLITLYLSTTDGGQKIVSVHVFDNIGVLNQCYQAKNIYKFNNTILVESLSFAFYKIKDGDRILVFERQNKTDCSPKFSRWKIDESQPIRLLVESRMPSKAKELLLHSISLQINPVRARTIAKTYDNRINLKEMRPKQFRKICSSYLQQEEEDLFVPQPQTTHLDFEKPDKPLETEIPVIWEKDAPQPPSWKTSVTLTIIPSFE
ncbi:hypothetical protein GPJ56_003947 [Histomonas meleagridis]|uniref:uncharacterized protein n=1 Tax=Histomonas meleagridis TaxID=135588 RepID=UPI003559575F|nr:hypothetical protein GPJ56_003947 [Histomonas meleagridis]KAH0798118.1 hypothetical protein GO595_009129 [Histomonas meleagridis]